MNGTFVLVSAMAAAWIAFVGFVAYKTGFLDDVPEMIEIAPTDDSTLEEDFNDILEFIPLNEVREIIERYAKNDEQIGETVNFINDQKRFVLYEFQQMPQVVRFRRFLRENGFELDRWQEELSVFWKSVPRFQRSDPSVAAGGLTVMISSILKTIPRDELHELLREKMKYSKSFRRLVNHLQSKEFDDFCHSVKNNNVLHHHYFWAKESGIEITFALELLKDLYDYLTQGLVIH